MSYKQLIGYEKNKRDSYFDGELEKEFSVSELLNGIEKPEQRQQNGQQIIHAQNYIAGNVSGGNLAGENINNHQS